MQSKFVKKAVYEVQVEAGQIVGEKEEDVSEETGLLGEGLPESVLYRNPNFKSLAEQLAENARLRDSGILDDHVSRLEADSAAPEIGEELYLSDLVDSARNRKAEEAEIEAFREEQELERLRPSSELDEELALKGGPASSQANPPKRGSGEISQGDRSPPAGVQKRRAETSSSRAPQQSKRLKSASGGMRLTVKIQRIAKVPPLSSSSASSAGELQAAESGVSDGGSDSNNAGGGKSEGEACGTRSP